MNGLSLRMPAKGNESKKSEYKIPALRLKESSISYFDNLLPSFRTFTNTPTVNAQLDYVRNVSKTLSTPEEDGVISSMRHILEFLVVIFLDAPLKHPLKNTCARLLSSQKVFYRDIEEIISVELIKTIHRCTISANNFEVVNNICNSLIGCFENFNPGPGGIQNCLTNVLNFLLGVLQMYAAVLKNDSSKLSPTEKMEIYIFIHNAKRVLLSMLQKCNVSSYSSESGCASKWREFCITCGSLLEHEDLPMDSAGICCMILIIILRVMYTSDAWIMLLKNCYNIPSDDATQKEISEYLSNSDSDGVKLMISSAVIKVVSLEDMCTKNIDNVPIINFITSKLVALGEELSVDTTIILGVARTMLCISRILNNVSDLKIAMTLADSVLQFVWSYLEYYVDSVRHLSTQTLTNIVKLSVGLEKKGNDQLSNKVFTSVMLLPKDRHSKYKGLATLGSEYGCCILLQKIPNLVEDLLSAINNVAVPSNISTAFETLMLCHSKEVSIDVLFETWIRPVLTCLMTCEEIDEINAASVLSILEDILAKAVKMNSEVVTLMMPNILPNMNNHGVLSEGQFKCLLVCLHVARKMGVFDSVESNKIEMKKWKNILEYSILENAVTHQSSEIRILAFSLIVDSHKTTEHLTEEEFDILQMFIIYNVNVQSPAIRQRSLGLIKKLLKRWKDSFDVILRNIENYLLKASMRPISVLDANQTLADADEALKQVYIRHIERLWIFCLSNLFPGANFSRRNMSLQILVWCQEFDNSCHVEWSWKEFDVKSLMFCLEDTYECNKKLAVDILANCPSQNLGFNVNANIINIFNEALASTASIKPTDSITAAYQLDFLTKFPNCVLPVVRTIANIGFRHPPFELQFLMITILVKHLIREMNIAKKNILVASSNGPMYGLLYCIRHLLGNIDFSAISACEQWSSTINQLIELSFEVNSIVGPVVNNSSPEGHLPMDFNAGTTNVEGNGVHLDNGKKVTAQMVLLCAWRSVKEVSLLLGDISSQAVIIEKGASSVKHTNQLLGTDELIAIGTISERRLLDIGDHFTTLLAETKHRGAFEQAYVGFSKLCSRLWKSNSSNLHNLPRIWLDDLIQAIASGDTNNSKLCATRRSAGVPFMVQALVTTELQVSGSPQSFQKCISTLLRLATFDNAGDSRSVSVETRTHCLNVLRALYRHTALGEHVNPYVADGLMTAVNGFDGATWAERNSSTLLFSSLMTRVFGVQRTKDSDALCIRNRMTGRIFFLRYPKLYDFILDHLQRVKTDSTSKDLLRPSLYPVLLLLARLYPSALEGTDSNLQLVGYIPYLLTCSESCVLKTRQLAAKAMVPLISPERYFAHFSMLFKMLYDRSIKKNYCHGILLQLIKILQSIDEKFSMDKSQMTLMLNDIEHSKWILLQIFDEKPCFVIADAYVQVILLFLKRFPSLMELKPDFFNSLKTPLIFDLTKLNPSYHLHSGKESFYIEGLHLHIYLSYMKKEMTDISTILLDSLKSPMYEVQLAALNYILCIYNNANIKMINEQFELGITEKDFVSMVPNNVLNNITMLLESYDMYRVHLLNLLKPNTYLQCKEKALMILTYLPDSLSAIVSVLNPEELIEEKMYLEFFIERCSSEHENISYIYLKCVHKCLEYYSAKHKSIYDCVSENTVNVLSEAIYQCCSSENVLFKRLAAAEIIIVFWKFLDWQSSKGSRYAAVLLQWSSIFQLLDDDDEIIRHRISPLANIFIGTYDTDLKNSSPPFNENKAKEVILQTFTRWMMESSDSHAVGMLTAISLGDSNTCVSNNDASEMEFRVFDKGEMNIFQEEIALARICAEEIRKILDRKLKNCTPTRDVNKMKITTYYGILNDNQDLKMWANNTRNSDYQILVDCLKKVIGNSDVLSENVLTLNDELLYNNRLCFYKTMTILNEILSHK